MQTPAQVPHIGFYRHYKHNPTQSVNNYTYEVLGTGLHTEIDGAFLWYIAHYMRSRLRIKLGNFSLSVLSICGMRM